MSCVSCGRYVPEGHLVCTICETQASMINEKASTRALDLSFADQELIEASGYTIKQLARFFREGKVVVSA